MADYIKRELAYKAMCDIRCGKQSALCVSLPEKCLSGKPIALIPSEDVAPVVHGYWMRARKPVTANMECSVCHKEYLLSDHNYCPNCGAKMDLEV